MKKEILGQSKPVRDLLAMIERVAKSQTNVLVVGESGTGKELVARRIHEDSPLKDRPFVAVNCGAIPENLIESEMFGHRKGSFTGAVSEKEGLFEAAHRGTLFLDEVGELPMGMQVKMLRAIQERVFKKVGGTEDITVDLRIIAATNRDLGKMVTQGKFREDLYYRLNVIMIRTPPLRERVEDIELLAHAFLKRYATKQGKPVAGFEPNTMEVLKSYSWPGNIRELENTLERAVTLEQGPRISVQSLPATVVSKIALGDSEKPPSEFLISLPKHDFSKSPVDLEAVLGKVEAVYLTAALQHSGGVKKKAADLLGITFRSMRYRLKKLGMDDDSDE